jgi:UDP-glucose 4-epimerase
MKCVVFGGGGFIGSSIVDRLLAAGHEIRVFERPVSTPYRVFDQKERVEWTTGDFLDIGDVRAAIDGMDVVLHLVSFTLPKTSNDDLIYDVQTNLVSTIQLLNEMVAKKVKKIVFISSGGTVYGTPQYLPVDERHPTDPMVSYGITKLAVEKYILMFRKLHQLDAKILRVANPYGPRQRVETAQGAVAAFLHKAMQKQPIEIWGDGSVTRDYIYIDDVADAFLHAVEHYGEETVFNISSGIGTDLNQLVKVIEEVLDVTVERKYLDPRSFDVPKSVLNNDLARDKLGWSPQVTLRDGIARTVKWLTGDS